MLFGQNLKTTQKLSKMQLEKNFKKLLKIRPKKMMGKKLVSPQIAQFRPKNTNHLKNNVSTMIGFGFHYFFLQNEITQVFFPLHPILLTNGKMTKNVLKNMKSVIFPDFFDCLL